MDEEEENVAAGGVGGPVHPMTGRIHASGRRELPRLGRANKRQVEHGVGRVA